MNLRRATTDDAPAFAVLAYKSYDRWTKLIGIPPTPVVGNYSTMLADTAHWEGWVLPMGEGTIAASLLFGIGATGFELWSIAVDPAHAQKGLGAQLMKFTESRAIQHGFSAVNLVTNIKMVANRAFYGRLGYQETGRKSLGGRQAVTMTKYLDGAGARAMTLDIYAARRAAYRKLHETGCFVQPNPWDAGTARWLRAKGFPALASTSAGFAWTKGRPDQDVPLDMMLGYIAEIVEAVPDLPVNADFEAGYADDLETLDKNIKLCVATGVAGISIEDATGNSNEPLYDFDTAVERVRMARKAIDDTGTGVMLTARAEAFLTNHPDPMADVLKKLTAFREAGADVLYAPGPRTATDMSLIVKAAKEKPVNMVVFADFGLSFADIAKLGVRRISIGSALAKAAWTGFDKATDMIISDGSFAGFSGNMASAPLNDFFADDLKRRDLF